MLVCVWCVDYECYAKQIIQTPDCYVMRIPQSDALCWFLSLSLFLFLFCFFRRCLCFFLHVLVFASRECNSVNKYWKVYTIKQKASSSASFDANFQDSRYSFLILPNTRNCVYSQYTFIKRLFCLTFQLIKLETWSIGFAILFSMSIRKYLYINRS